MTTKSIQLSEIVTTAGTQIRAKIDTEVVETYAVEMIDGAQFPPVDIFHDGNQYILADGFHRVMAAARNGFKDVLAVVHKGTKSDALKFALAANATHGLKLSPADKRRSVVLALEEWPKLSDRELAKICSVSDKTVAAVRNETTAEIPQLLKTRIGADGKERKLPTKKPTPTRDDDTEPDEQTDAPHIKTPAEEMGELAEKLNPAFDEQEALPPVEERTTYWYERVEIVCNEALETANVKQLNSLMVFAKILPGKIKDSIKKLQ